MDYKKRVDEILNNSKLIIDSDPENVIKQVLDLYSEFEDSSDYETTGQLCKFIGTLYLKNSNSASAQKFYFQAISNFKLVDNFNEIAKIYNNLVISSYYLHKYEMIEEYSRLALDYFEKSRDAGGIISVTNNLAKYYRNINSYDKAFVLLEDTLKRYKNEMDREDYLVMSANFANVCLNKGDIEKGLDILLDLSDKVKNTKFYNASAVTHLYLTEYYESIGDYKLALESHKKRYNSAIIGRQESISSDINNYLHTLNIDIDRLQYERTLKQNKELIQAHDLVTRKNGFLETLINTIPIPLFYCDNNFIYLGCNDSYTKYFNKSREEIIGKQVGFTLVNQEEIAYLTQMTWEAKSSNKSIKFIANITKEEGVTRTVEIVYSNFFDESSEPSGMLCMLKDITADIEQQKVVKELNAHLKSILESAPKVYICSIDKNYKYTYFNKNYAQSVKRHIGLEVKKGFDYFRRYQSQAEISDKRKLLSRVFAGETISGVREYTNLEKPEILQYYYSPIIEDDGQIIGATVFSYDITMRVLAQRDLALSNKTKDKFFSIIAHDLRSPIGNIKSALEFLTTERDLSQEDLMEMLDKLSSSAINTYDLLENLLQWSLTERGLIENNSEYYYLSELIDQAIKITKNIAHSKNIQLETLCSSAIQVYVDKNMFFTILRNLINNAIKYSYENSSIIIRATSDDKYGLIKVIDHGIGIKKEVIPYLNQMDKTVTTYGTSGEKGSGLGLVLCNELVTKVGGKLWVESQEGKGSTFYFTIPVKDKY